MQCYPLCRPRRQCRWLNGHYQMFSSMRLHHAYIYSASRNSFLVPFSARRIVNVSTLGLKNGPVLSMRIMHKGRSGLNRLLMIFFVEISPHLLISIHIRHADLHSCARARGIVDMTSGRRTGLGKAATTRCQVQVVAVDRLLEGRPGLGLPGYDTEDVHGVDLLKGALLGLVDEEEGDQDAEEAAAGKDVAILVADGTGDPRGEEGDEEVPQPVGGGAETHGHGTVPRGEHLSDNGPDKGTPLFDAS